MGLLSDKTTRELKTGAVNLLISHYTGEPAQVDRHADFNEISFTPEQARKLRAQLDNWMNAEAGDLQVNIKPVLLPWILKKYGLWALGITGGLILIGRLLK